MNLTHTQRTHKTDLILLLIQFLFVKKKKLLLRIFSKFERVLFCRSKELCFKIENLKKNQKNTRVSNTKKNNKEMFCERKRSINSTRFSFFFLNKSRAFQVVY